MELKNREEKERMGKEGEDGKSTHAAFFPLSLKQRLRRLVTLFLPPSTSNTLYGSNPSPIPPYWETNYLIGDLFVQMRLKKFLFITF